MRDIDKIIELTRRLCPTVDVEQLQVSHPGDDNGLWCFDQPDSEYQVQVESSTGMCPFLIETDENAERFTTNSVEETVQTLLRLLHVSPAV
jgi:hypothetical protein